MRFFLVILFLANQALAGTLETDFKKYLPPNFVSRAERALQNVDLDKAEKFGATTSVKFVSGQSYSASGLHIINRIKFFPGRDLDIWLMNQKGGGSTNWLAKQWSTLTLLIDKTTIPKTAYFLQWDKNSDSPSMHPVPFTAMCFTCHSNGPRVLRPQYLPRMVKLGHNDWEKIYNWNQIISDYGEIQTYKPRVDILFQELPLDLPGRIDNEPLLNKNCTECHGVGSGVRSPLFRQNGGSILALTENTADPTGYYVPALHQEFAFMPFIGHKLSAADLHCLKDWIQNRKLQPPRPACNARGEAVPQK